MKLKLNKNLTNREKKAVENLLDRINPNIDCDLKQMWYLLDLVWDDYGCNSKKLDWEKLAKFYSDPIWLLNGLFIEQHDLSMQHRNAISSWITARNFKNIIDYGGGFATLARLIARKNRSIQVDIYEPYPSEFGLRRIKEFDSISIVDGLINNHYDCLISTDVLEHVYDPLKKFESMIRSVKVGGFLIIANCFKPVIKCHLPQTFHLDYTFNRFSKTMGLGIVGILNGSHATIFKKIEDKDINWSKVRFFEKLSKIAFPVLNFLKPVLRPIKKLVF